jgi:hypothetical protein
MSTPSRRIRRQRELRASDDVDGALPSGGYQADSSDLCGYDEAVGWAPVAGADADVDREILQSMQSCGKRLEIPYE